MKNESSEKDQAHRDDKSTLKELGFGRRIGFGERPAVVVIDMIKGFTDPSRILGYDFDNQIQVINEVMGVGRARSVPVIFISSRYDDKELKDAGVWARKIKGAETLGPGTDGWEVDSRLKRAENDQLIIKKYASSFFGTSLFSLLVSQRIDTLIITGCTTSGCVRATTVDAVQYGFRPIVVEEAVGDRLQSAHEQSLVDMDAKYADVLSKKEVTDYLRKI